MTISLSRRRAAQWLLATPPLAQFVVGTSAFAAPSTPGAVARAWPAAETGAGAATGSAPGQITASPRSSQHLFLYDARQAPALTIAQAVLHAGTPTLPIDGDVGTLWRQYLRSFWRAENAILASITGTDTLFCLDLLARDAGRRLCYQAPLGESDLAALWAPETQLEAARHAPLASTQAGLHARLITT
ncbi:hypothetical protein GJ699_07465 [Duganella sp. FT80W]|uniref:Uncharacterized protein n=1 Tax=Duganella guangzhouensis TaxID=2666084 RepID=A0A6I2KV70_9BURK|nr:hypothetical protein [Duganella guangzhouensis]MRW89818.1 hypothetical protein [Duganella guangzhouensis]